MNQLWKIVNWPLGNKLQWNHNRNFKKMHLKMSSGKCRPFCLGQCVELPPYTNLTNIFEQYNTRTTHLVFKWVRGCYSVQTCCLKCLTSLRWRHNDHAGVSNHQPHGCLLNRLFRRKSKKTSKLRVTGLCAGNSPGTGEFPAQMASYVENVSIWWRHHVIVSEWHIHASVKRASIGSDNGLLPDRHQDFCRNQCGIILNWTVVEQTW